MGKQVTICRKHKVMLSFLSKGKYPPSHDEGVLADLRKLGFVDDNGRLTDSGRKEAEVWVARAGREGAAP